MVNIEYCCGLMFIQAKFDEIGAETIYRFGRGRMKFDKQIGGYMVYSKDNIRIFPTTE